MIIDKILDEIKEKISKSSLFQGVKIIMAYENKIKPVRLANPVIALGIDSVELSSDSIDENGRSGEIKIFADIFVPVDNDAMNAQEIFINICKILSCYNVLSVTAGRMTYESQTQAYLLATSVCFKDMLDFGGA